MWESPKQSMLFLNSTVSCFCFRAHLPTISDRTPCTVCANKTPWTNNLLQFADELENDSGIVVSRGRLVTDSASSGLSSSGVVVESLQTGGSTSHVPRTDLSKFHGTKTLVQQNKKIYWLKDHDKHRYQILIFHPDQMLLHKPEMKISQLWGGLLRVSYKCILTHESITQRSYTRFCSPT